jgi:hypothetical protein
VNGVLRDRNSDAFSGQSGTSTQAGAGVGALVGRRCRHHEVSIVIDPDSGQHDAGPTGGGKSHLSTTLGLALVENGWRGMFARTTDLVQRLQVARRELALESSIAKLDRPTSPKIKPKRAHCSS